MATATQPLTLLTLNITHLVLALSPGRSRLSSCVLAFKTVVEHVLNNENKLPLWVWPPPIWTLELGLCTQVAPWLSFDPDVLLLIYHCQELQSHLCFPINSKATSCQFSHLNMLLTCLLRATSVFFFLIFLHNNHPKFRSLRYCAFIISQFTGFRIPGTVWWLLAPRDPCRSSPCDPLLGPPITELLASLRPAGESVLVLVSDL